MGGAPGTIDREAWAGSRRGRTWLGPGLVRRVVVAAAAVALVAAGGYGAYVGVIGSREVAHKERKPLCATPADWGWAYEAINYDQAGDAALAGERNKENCARPGPPAGDAVVSRDGTRIAGWYVPAARGGDPRAPTVVLVHGWGSNKSDLLRYAATLHETFHVVMFDLRASGQSSGDTITVGVREQWDLVAILDWLERTKAPRAIGVLGDSGGGATAILAARNDARVRALVLDSTHARFRHAVAAVGAARGYPAANEAAWAVYAGLWVRTGVNFAEHEPIDAIRDYGDRPLLFIHSTTDAVDIPAESVDLNYRVALDAGVPAEIRWCDGAEHGQNPNQCPDAYRGWVNEFFERTLGG